MAEVAVSILAEAAVSILAEAAVSTLLEKIEYLLEREWNWRRSTNSGLDNLKRELEIMIALLKDADGREHDHRFRAWVRQVRDLAYEIENVLDMFAFHLARQPTQWLTRFEVPRFIIEGIKEKLDSIRQTRERYATMTSSHAASSSSPGNYTNFHRRNAPLYMEDADIVGIKEPKGKLISWALRGSQRLKVMFVVGMGGSGKTTLVRKVYENVKEEFDCHAWITVSRAKEKIEILWNMFNRLHYPATAETTPQSFSHLNEDDMVEKLRNHLQGKRYIIVLDDLWIKDVWESIRHALPRSSFSRIFITTRRGDIAYSCSANIPIEVHNLQPLPPEKAQELFYKKAFPQTGSCPSGLVQWSWFILKKCEGLPLGIIEIGQFLSNRQKTEAEWKRLHDGLESELRRDGRLSNISRVLSISYNDLPYHLKYCFLYLSNFPENYTIKRRRLIRLWIAEGFVKKETGRELEDIGEEYLKELIERSLIQACEWDFDRKPRSCRVHSLMHKIILPKARYENFCTVYKEQERNLIDEKTRQLSIQKSGFNMSKQNFPYVRTLFMFENQCEPGIPSSLKLLKVLHLEGARLDRFPSEIAELFLLRYLCLSHTQIKSIPKSLGNLCHLETLDLKQTFVTKLPNEIAKLDKLRHLLVSNYTLGSYVTFDCVEGFEVSENIGKLRNLQKLSFVKANRHHGLIRALGHLSQLRKLGIIDLSEADGTILCSSIQMLRNLQSLNVTSLQKEERLNLQAITHPPPLLQRLYLKGCLEKMPVWISGLHDLARIRLKWSRLTSANNPIQILQDLPHLLELQLLDAYTGNQLDFNSGKFQKLEILELEQLEQLRKCIMQSGTLPCLRKLIIRWCGKLVQVPVGIDKLTQLKELHLYAMPLNFVNPLKRNGGKLRHMVRQIPEIHSYKLNRYEQWVLEDLS